MKKEVPLKNAKWIWDGFCMILLSSWSRLQRCRKHHENTKILQKQMVIYIYILFFVFHGQQFFISGVWRFRSKAANCACFRRSEVEKPKPEDADEIDEIATASSGDDIETFLMYQ